MTSIRKAKKLGIYKVPKRTKESKQLYNETQQIVNDVNKRLRTLEKSGYGRTWSAKKLFNRMKTKKLDVYYKGRIKLKRNLTNTQLIGIQQKSKQFLVSRTSTVKGIEEVKNETLESLKATFSQDKKLKDADVEAAYEMLSNKDFEFFNQEDKIGASTMWAIIEDATELDFSEETFLKRLQSIWDFSNDEDAVKKAKRIYDLYV